MFAINFVGNNLGIPKEAHLSGEFFSLQASTLVRSKPMQNACSCTKETFSAILLASEI
jgi:hypothetical protein